MKNKITFLIVVLAIFFGLLLYINFNRKSKEKKKAEIEKIEERKKFVQDSLRLDNENKMELKRIEQKNIEISNRTEKENAERLRLIEEEKIARAKRINGYTNKISAKLDVAILITDDSGQSTNDISSKIASIYSDQGFSVSNSLFTTSFIKSDYLSELQNSSSEVIDMLNLNARSKYVVIGKINYSFRNGTLSTGTTICNAKISVDIISVNLKSTKKDFTISVNGNGVSESQAKENAQQLLINKYSSEYSSL